MIFGILPVKSPKNAKQRLSGFLTADQREALARTMYDQMLETLGSVRGLDRVVVVTSDTANAEKARTFGFEVFVEETQISHSHSADEAATKAAAMGATTVVLLPIDVPMVTPEEIESLIDGPLNGLIVVPSSDGAGTNALVRTPPNVIQARFGPGSFRAHCSQAEAAGVPLEVRRPAGLLFDIDEPEDVERLIATAPDSRLGKLLKQQTGRY